MRTATMMLALVVVLVAAPACTGFHAGKEAKAGGETKAGKEAYTRGDYATALKELRPLAEQGDANMQFKLGVMYQGGLGVSQDYAQAVRWYRLAADQGHAMSQAALGMMYRDGTGVVQNYKQAYMWFNLAATQGFETAREVRDYLAKEMTSAQIDDAQRLTREWKARSKWRQNAGKRRI